MESPDSKQAIDPTAAVLKQGQVDTIVATLRQAVSAINSEVSILHNPFDPEEGKFKADDGVKLTPTASAVNDDETNRRWRNKALKLMVRRKPETAEDLIESRIAVVGNVVSPGYHPVAMSHDSRGRTDAPFPSPTRRYLTAIFRSCQCVTATGRWQILFTGSSDPESPRRWPRKSPRVAVPA